MEKEGTKLTREQEEIRDYILNCIAKLAKRHYEYLVQDEERDNEIYESDLHADLFVLLNMEKPEYWKNYQIQMGNKPNFRGCDIVVYDMKDTEAAFIELKYFRKDEPITEDLNRLLRSKGPISILLYAERESEQTGGMEKDLKSLMNGYKDIILVYIHPDYHGKALILKSGKFEEIPLK
jgi:hypothetical protein